MVDHTDINKEHLVISCSDAVLAVEELYRCERVFILQPQRIILDGQHRKLRSEYRRLLSLLHGNGQKTERAHIDDLLQEQLRLAAELKVGIDEAGQIQEYSNY